MFGWEFPPHISGGLGTACYGLSKSLSQIDDLEITFVVPKRWGDEDLPNITFVGADQVPVIQKQIQFDDLKSKIQYYELHSQLIPYLGTAEYEALKAEKLLNENRFIEVTGEGKFVLNGGYGATLFQEIRYYTLAAEALAKELEFDIIHVHDWMCFQAGIAAKRVSGKPLVAHIHSTEFDRCGKTVNPLICIVEKEGLMKADKVIAVSELTRSIIVRNYGIDPGKTTVVHNAVEAADYSVTETSKPYSPDKTISFLGRVTMQKGPGYFVEAAGIVAEKIKNVRFVMAGKGDLLDEMKKKTAELNLSGYFEFPGFVSDEDIGKLFLKSSVFVMPSVSEPFGIVALEAMQAGVAVIVSRQSGVAEVVKNAVKVDYWDSVALAEAIIELVENDHFRKELAIKGKAEARKILWKRSAAKVHKLYKSLVRQGWQ
jgi:Glycosyltransferase